MKNMKLALLPMLLCLPFTMVGCGGATETITIGLECDYAPFNWTTYESSEYTLPISNKANAFADGYDIQIAKYLGQELNKEVKIVALPWDTLIPDLVMESIDLVIAGMTDTEERRQTISFTDEYYRSELVLITSKTIADQYQSALNSDQLRTLINGKIIVSQKGTVTNDVIVNTFAKDYGATAANPLESFALAATDVSNGSAFAMTAELPVAQSIVANFTNLGIIHIDQAILGEAQAELGVSIGLRKTDVELQTSINEALAKLTTDERVEIMAGALERSA